MSTFKLSTAVSVDKVFLIQRAQLGGRFDSQFHAELPELTGFVKLLTLASVTGGKRLPPMANYASDFGRRLKRGLSCRHFFKWGLRVFVGVIHRPPYGERPDESSSRGGNLSGCPKRP